MRMMLLEVVNDLGQDTGTNAGEAADAQQAQRCFLFLFGYFLYDAHFTHESSHRRNKAFSCRRQLERFSPFSFDYRHAKLLFQSGNGLADRRLGHIETSGGLSKTAVFQHGKQSVDLR